MANEPGREQHALVTDRVCSALWNLCLPHVDSSELTRQMHQVRLGLERLMESSDYGHMDFLSSSVGGGGPRSDPVGDEERDQIVSGKLGKRTMYAFESRQIVHIGTCLLRFMLLRGELRLLSIVELLMLLGNGVEKRDESEVLVFFILYRHFRSQVRHRGERDALGRDLKVKISLRFLQDSLSEQSFDNGLPGIVKLLSRLEESGLIQGVAVSGRHGELYYRIPARRKGE